LNLPPRKERIHILAKEVEIELYEEPESILTSLDIVTGQAIPALTRLKIFDAESWEDVTLELVSYWKSKYERIVRCGGGGDMGRDVIAYSKKGSIIWESFQCKHYKNKLNLSQALLEIGKLLYYAYKGEFTVPRKYYFVSPCGISTDLLNHVMDSKKLKTALTTRWDKCCKNKITTKDDEIILTEDFLNFINKIDFSIFDHIPPIKIIELHANTQFHASRFGTHIKKRPKLPTPPRNPAANEVVYTSELIRAFSDAEGTTIDIASLSECNDYREEYDSARKNFYAAEGLEKFSRDWLPENCYQELIEECYEVVSSTVRGPFDNGYERYLSTSTHASNATYLSHPLKHYIKTQDKKGMCHQLVNLKRFKWVKD